MSAYKVRFAPSPTGLMHVGNARVAIINYLFAKQNNGKFLFRIDDTDINRSKKEYEISIKNDINWLGISYDETFRQSERLSRYKEVLNDLLNKNIVYKCYEGAEELEFKRKKALLKGEPPIYDRSALNLTQQEKERLELNKTPFYLRFKLPNKTINWKDLILGDISYDLNNISDPVIVKTDGTFLYSFCSVIDDIDFGITHILRGQDHVTNTAAQIAMIDEISNNNYKIKFGHFSLLINKDGSQFSKRLGSMNLGDFRNNGIDPIAICSLLATLGTSKDILPITDISDLIEYFDINSFSSNSPKFDINQLLQLNKKIIRSKSFAEIKNSINLQMNEKSFEIIKYNIENYNDLKKWDEILSPSYKLLVQNKSEVVNVFHELLSNQCANNQLFLTKEQAQHLLNEVSKITLKKGRDLYMPIQQAILGISKGPHLVDSLTMFEISELLRRTTN